MSVYIDQSPDPKSHIKTLMRIGYTFSSAVSDILDNSISARSRNIHINSPLGLKSPLISIVDDGYGMDKDELIQNMKIGCKDPDLERKDGDLGRFGSGMKTASFSQAKRLTVVSKKNGQPIVAARWDIDKVESTNSWCLEILDINDINGLDGLDGIELDLLQKQGTQIIWDKLTFIQTGMHSLDHDLEIASKLAKIREYIALYFHRFMTGKNRVDFFINDRKIDPVDPFMIKNDGYQEGRSERLRCKGGYIVIKTHVLPHFKRMDVESLEKLGGAAGIAENQGLYVFRENRLIIAGGWLGLAKSSAMTSLARVQVDVPSSIDSDWSTDVKKSSLQLPTRVKNELKKFLSDPIKKSKTVHSYRGKLDQANKYWKICEDENEGTITYQIDPENEALLKIVKLCNSEAKREVFQYLTELSLNIPIHHIFQKMSERPKDVNQEMIDSQELKNLLSKII